MTTASHREAAGRSAWLVAYAVAMGVLEAVVVMYLRALYYPSGFAFPLVTIPARLAVAEILREATTLVMLLSVAMLAGKGTTERFFSFGLLFGVWDLVYYLALRVGLGWPSSLFTWDILFLIPVPWVAPVLYPVLVSALLVFGYAGFESLRLRGCAVAPTRLEWSIAMLGCLGVIVSFCWNYRLAATSGVPAEFPVAIFTTGLLLGVAPLARAMSRGLRSPAGS